MTNLLSDIITYVRRIIKSPSDAVITDDLIIDYINRFWIIDVDARLQLFDLKTKYQFQTAPGVDQYNMPLYNVQTENASGDTIGMFPVYQGFEGPCFINGIQMPFYTERNAFYNLWPNYNQTLVQSGTGNGSAGPYTLTLPFLPNSPGGSNVNTTSGILRGHVDMTGIISTGVNQDPPLSTNGSYINNSLNLPIIPSTSILPQVYITTIGTQGQNVVVSDTGIFLGTTDSNARNYGLLMTPGNAPFGNAVLPGGYSITSNTVNYLTGIAKVTFPVAIPSGQQINTQAVYYQMGIPRAVLFWNNTIILRAPPNTQYLVELDAYLTPAAFFNTAAAIPFGYMAEYIARGAARKILSDTGDTEQFYFYEPLFKEQELLVWKRSQRQFTSTRSQTIYSQQGFQGNYNQSSFGI